MTAIDDHAAIALFRAVLDTPSLSGEEAAVAELLRREMAGLGFDAHIDPAGNVVGEIEGPDPHAAHLLILGHMDTVWGDVPVEERDGRLYGRGAVDAKGPLVAGIVAAARARVRGRVTVIGAAGEEASSPGARHIAGTMAAPDALIIAEPSGADAVVLGYKGSQRFTVTWRQGCAHTAGSEPTAPERCARFWSELQAWCGQQTLGAEGEFRRLTPRLISMASESDGLSEYGCLQIGMRLPPGVSVEQTRTGIQSLWPEAEFRFSPGEEPVLAARNTPLVAAFMRSMRGQGLRPRFKVKTGTSDMNVVGPVWNVPMAAYGPGDSALDHTPDEHVPLDEWLRGVAVLTAVLEDL